jgi:PAP2 superfamily
MQNLPNASALARLRGYESKKTGIHLPLILDVSTINARPLRHDVPRHFSSFGMGTDGSACSIDPVFCLRRTLVTNEVSHLRRTITTNSSCDGLAFARVASMAWEKLTRSRQNSLVLLVILSAVWLALVIAGALLTNFDEPYLPFAIAGGFVFFSRGAPSRWEIYAWLLLSALFVKVIHLPQVPFWLLRVASSFAVLGFGALLLLGFRALWSEREGRDNAVALLVPALVLVFFMLACANVLRWTSGLSPETDDAWLYAFDGSLGFQPSFWMGKIMYGSIVLIRSTLLTYLSLPFAMAVVCAWKTPVAARRVSWYMLIVLSLAGIAGWVLYNVVPGTGPIYAFSKDFPWNAVPYKALSTFALEKMSIPLGVPRNGMPSLHMGWVILLWWNSRGLPRALRAFLAFYLCLTVVATLGSGQHYLVDLVVSLPFALAVQAAASYGLPHKSRRIAALVAGLALTMVWLLMVRFGVAWALKSPIIPWTLILATTATTLWLESWMSERSTGTATEDLSAVVTKPVQIQFGRANSSMRG